MLRVSEVFVFPSAYREGVPRVLLEAASMGLPLVTTDAPGCREVVVDGENGYLIPIRDQRALQEAIEQLLEQPQQSLSGRVGRPIQHRTHQCVQQRRFQGGPGC